MSEFASQYGNLIDYAVLVAFIVLTIGNGLRARAQASESPESFFLANRSLKGSHAGVSMAATQFGADTPLFITGLVATAGIFGFWRLWIYGLAFLVMGYLLGRAWRRANVLTDAELTEVRYSSRAQIWLRGFKGVYYGTIINCVVMAFVMVAATRVFEVFLPWHLWLPESFYVPLHDTLKDFFVHFSIAPIFSEATSLTPWQATTNNVFSIVCLFIFTASYSSTGGLRAVVRTDILQFGIMMLGTAAYAYFAVKEAGGWTHTIDTVVSHYGDKAGTMLSVIPTGTDILIPFLIATSLLWVFQSYADGTGYLAQRTMACKSDKDAREAAVVFSFAQIFLRSALWMPIIIALLVLYPFDPNTVITDTFTKQKETTFILGINDHLPFFFKGLLITSLIAALASTIDSHLNWGASYWTNDLYKAIYKERIKKEQASPKTMVLVARLSSVIIIIVTLIIMLFTSSIRTGWEMSILFGSGTGLALLLRWLWEKVNVFTELAAIAVSLVGAPLVYTFVTYENFPSIGSPEFQFEYQLLCMSIISTIVIVLTSLLAPGTSPDKLKKFYDVVRPPGFWGQTAQAVGEPAAAPMKRFGVGLFGIVCCALTIFGALIGTITLMTGQSHWTVALLLYVIGVVAIPGWRWALRTLDKEVYPESPAMVSTASSSQASSLTDSSEALNPTI